MDLGAINRKVDFFLVNLGRKNFLEEEEEEDHAIGDTEIVVLPFVERG